MSLLHAVVLVLSLNANAARLEKFTDKEKGFTVGYPRGWETKVGELGAAVILLSPVEGTGDEFRENINVVVEDLKSPMSTKDYFSETQKVLKKAFTDYKSEKSGSVKIANREFYWSVFSHRLGKVKARVQQHMTVRGNRAYVITASSAPEKFAKYKPSFDAAIGAFELKEARDVTKK